MGIIGWIASALAGVLVLSALLLVVPLRLQFLWGDKKKTLTLRYLGLSIEYDFADKCRRLHLLNWTLACTSWSAERETHQQPLGREPADRPQAPASVANQRSRSPAKACHLWNYRAALRKTALVIVRFLGRMIRAWRFERAKVSVVAGFGDPAQTGMATGWFHSIWSAIAPRLPRVQVAWNPCFEQRKLTVDADVILRVLPVQLVYHGITALATLPWRALWELRKAMRKKEELCRIT